MVDYKFSLELTKNGIQKSIHAKAGENNSRRLVITLTEAGKIFALGGLNAKVFLEDGKYLENAASVVGNTVEVVIPKELVSAEGVRFCEIKIFRDDMELYSPMIEIIVEKSFGNISEEEAAALGKPVQYQELIAMTSQKEEAAMADDDSIVIYDTATGTVMRLSWVQFLELHNKKDSHPIEAVAGLKFMLDNLAPITQLEALRESSATKRQVGEMKDEFSEAVSEITNRIAQEEQKRAAADNNLTNTIKQAVSKVESDVMNAFQEDFELLSGDVVKNREDIAGNSEALEELQNKVEENQSAHNRDTVSLTNFIETVRDRGDSRLSEEASRLEKLIDGAGGHTHSNKEALDSFGLNTLGTRPTFKSNYNGTVYIIATTGDVQSSCIDLENKLNGNIQNIRQLPSVSESDNGKALVVDGGVWAAANVNGGKVKKVFIPYDESCAYGCYTFTENNNTPMYVSNEILDEHGINEICPVDLTVLWEGQEMSVAELNKKAITGKESPAFINLMNPRDIDNTGEDKMIGTIYNAIGGGSKSLADFVGFDGTYFGGVYLYYFDKD